MDIVTLLTRCIALERGAGEVYRMLAARAGGDAELVRLWTAMARDEDQHADKLDAWRTLVLGEPPERRTCADGFDAGVRALEALMAHARAEAARVTTADEAFALALALERSELDAIYTTLLQASPIARFPDGSETYRRETADHHDALVAAVAARPTTEANTLAAALLAAAHRERR
jgi:rubrerythrin